MLEFDDEFSKIWFKNLQTYIENDGDETFAFVPLTEIVDYSTKESFGYANEAVWASSFSEDLGYFDLHSIEDYLNFNASGGAFKTHEFLNIGGLKGSMNLVFWYEFLMRALYKGKKIFVIPKIGYYHLANRPDSLTAKYIETMDEILTDKEITLVDKNLSQFLPIKNLGGTK